MGHSLSTWPGCADRIVSPVGADKKCCKGCGAEALSLSPFSEGRGPFYCAASVTDCDSSLCPKQITFDSKGKLSRRALLCHGQGPLSKNPELRASDRPEPLARLNCYRLKAIGLQPAKARRPDGLRAGSPPSPSPRLIPYCAASPMVPRFWVRVPILRRVSPPEVLRSSAQYFEIRSGIPVGAFQGI
jgi:hypothetical protein